MGSKKHIESTNTTSIPPVVAVLGHVDHGKTSLLDAIRKTSIVDREFGGITQKIGASPVEIEHDGKRRTITFIDTPGHEAFMKMRSRGAQAADIGLLIVSAVDGVKPQTKESIKHLLEAKVPFIVVLTKADMPTKQVERAKQQILQEGVLLEGLGGEVPVIEVSAKTRQNIPELLDLILLVWDMRPNQEDAAALKQASLRAIVIESRLDPKSGPKATVVVKSGTLKTREDVQVEDAIFRIRTLITDLGKNTDYATVGDAVEILGLSKVPSVGSLVTAKHGQTVEKAPQAPLKKEMVYKLAESTEDKLAIVLCADTQGSLEAISYSLPEGVTIVSKKTGEVTEADVLLAKSTGALVLSFNSRIRPDVAKLAQTEKVLAKNYNIIYEMLDEIGDVMEGKKLAMIEEIYGTAQIMAKFPFNKTFAYGIRVTDGRVARSDKLRIMRGESVIGETTFNSLRIGKETTSKVEKGHEAGVVFNGELDITIGDMIICHG